MDQQPQIALAWRVDAQARARVAPIMIPFVIGWGWLACCVFGPRTGLPWLAAMALAELWLVLAATPVFRARAPTWLAATSFFAPTFGSVAGWTGLAALMWSTQDPGLALAAAALLLGELAFGASMAFSSPLALGAFSTLAGGAMAWGLISHPLFKGNVRLAVLAALGTNILLIVGAVFNNLKNRQRYAKVIRDLEESQRAARAAEEAKSAFLATMSHELRTPLNGVLGMARALAGTPLAGRQREYVEVLVGAGEGLLDLLNDVLDHSKIEAGRLDLEIKPFSVGRLVRQVAALWEVSAEAKGLALECVVQPEAEVWLAGDAGRIRQILSNLASNAVKFTEAGVVRVEAAVTAREGDARDLILRVIDTGPGISKEGQAKLFQPFAQADASVSRIHGGTGLGLSICRRLTQLMDGSIEVASELGAGAAFEVRLPLVAAAPPLRKPPPASPRPARLRILAADDNLANRLVLQALLEAETCDLTLVEDGASALERLTSNVFDVVLMDIHMPGLDGKAVLRQIRAGQAGRPDIPVIALTAEAEPEQCAALRAMGFDAHVAKPIDPAMLLAAVRAAGERTTATASGPSAHSTVAG